MLLILFVQIYTARIILNTLGVKDYGIYNVIAGVIVLFSFINNSMTNSSQRFITYSIGKGLKKDLVSVFNTSFYCHLFISIILLFLAETIGLWFVTQKLVLPSDRYFAALWVYQISVLNAFINIIKVPYNALIISNERMGFYAYVSIFEAIAKLLVIYVLLISSIDKLILYSILSFIVSFILFVIVIVYCNIYFPYCKLRLIFDRGKSIEMIKFSIWNMLNGGVSIANQQGGNMMLNIFFGVTFNAAYGIANQVSSVINMFVSNFQMAFEPQIVKQYAAREYSSLIKLIFRTSLLSYLLLLIISIPFITESKWILDTWLGTPPEYAGIFCVILVIYFMIDAIQAPLWMVIGASGSIKEYSIWNSLINILNLPIAYLILIHGGSVLWIFMLRVLLNLLCAIIRVPYTRKFLRYSIKQYMLEVVLPAVIITIITITISFKISYIVNSPILSIIFSLLFTVFVCFALGLRKNERIFVWNQFKKRILFK